MQGLEPSIKAKVDSWLNGNYDDATKAELQRLLDQHAVTELTDSFYKDLEFGTGGLRGIMGVGSNRMNKYTIGAATQGFANYLKATYPSEQIKVVIAHDSRNNATLFASVTANVFTANGIEVHLFSELRPTPQLSFACRHLNAHAGVMLTASHNPKEYNGYKAYGRDGGQLIAPHDKNVVNEVAKIKSVDEIKFEGNPALLHALGTEMDDAYLTAITKESISPDVIAKQKDLKIVFSPIHGTGFKMVPPALKAYGFENVMMVEEQCTMDGNFPTVIYPNPEEHEALTMALNKAKAVDADLVMATDPDADRVGIAVKNDKGEFILLNGNQTGSLLMDYVLRAWAEKGKLNKDTYVVKTIVTSFLMDTIAASYNVDCYNVLTGFKFIGAMMTANEGKRRFVVGGEESYGYLVGEHARDKDAVIACTMIAEMTAFYKEHGSSLFEALQELYLKHGYYKEKLISLTKKGKAGAEEIKEMMQNYRVNTPKSLGGSDVAVLKDYELRKQTNLKTGEVTEIELPKSDVLQFVTEDGSVISARPSGTEPKIKFYCSVKGKLTSKADFDSVSAQLDAKIDAVMKDLGVA